jgi:diguanylate cyclase (GGDEF)-like protein
VSSPPDDAWQHLGFGLLTAGVLGLVLRGVRQRSEAQLDDARQAADLLATSDGLTGLLNRRGLELVGDRVLAAARRDGRAVGVLFLDLDGLKPVNDRLGHAAGDAVLVDVGRRLAAAFREADAVARVGGDEFAVLLHGPQVDTVELLRQRAQHCLAGIAASVGAAVSEEPVSVSLAQLVDAADAAMYQEKAARRAGVPVQR